MTHARLIGIAGGAGAGKDTLADALVATHGYHKYSLAEPIKSALNAMFDWPPDLWNNRAWKEAPLARYGASPRKLAQTLGTEWGRTIHPDFWLLRAQQEWDNLHHPAVLDVTFDPMPRMVIPDIRFVNEAAWVLAQGGLMVRIHRVGLDPIEAHSSEAGVPDNLVHEFIANTYGAADEFAEGALNSLRSRLAD